MDRDHWRRFADLLDALPQDAPATVILVLENPAAPAAGPILPEQFTTRTAYRQALISQRRAETAPPLERLERQVRALGLETRTQGITNTLIATGPIAALRQLEELDGIVKIHLDEDLPLSRSMGGPRDTHNEGNGTP